MLPHPIAASLTLVFIWMGLGTIDGKCAGKWAIHACGGGNGKRSDAGGVFPSAASSGREVSLKQMLLSLQQQAPHTDRGRDSSDRDSSDRDSDVLLRPTESHADEFYGRGPAAGRATSSGEAAGGYLPMADMLDEYQQQQMDDLQRQYDEQQLRTLWAKLIASLKSRRVGRH